MLDRLLRERATSSGNVGCYIVAPGQEDSSHDECVPRTPIASSHGHRQKVPVGSRLRKDQEKVERIMQE